MHYFTTLFWQRTLRVSDRFSVRHQESYYCIRSSRCHTSCVDCQL